MIPEVLLSEPIAFHGPALHGWIQKRREFAERMNLMTGENRLSISDFFNQRQGYMVHEGIGFIHANDFMALGLTNVDKITGMTDYGDLSRELEQAANDPAVKGILLSINSPGGSALGSSEAAQSVLDARQAKPVVAAIEKIGASAGYKIAAPANAIVASQTAVVGSIGTITTHMEFSAMLAAAGIKVNIITPQVSDLKATGNQYREMTPKEREFLQESTERTNAEFLGWVSEHRGVDASVMRGQWFSGKEGAQNGLVDYVGGLRTAMTTLKQLIGLKS